MFPLLACTVSPTLTKIFPASPAPVLTLSIPAPFVKNSELACRSILPPLPSPAVEADINAPSRTLNLLVTSVKSPPAPVGWKSSKPASPDEVNKPLGKRPSADIPLNSTNSDAVTSKSPPCP